MPLFTSSIPRRSDSVRVSPKCFAFSSNLRKDSASSRTPNCVVLGFFDLGRPIGGAIFSPHFLLTIIYFGKQKVDGFTTVLSIFSPNAQPCDTKCRGCARNAPLNPSALRAEDARSASAGPAIRLEQHFWRNTTKRPDPSPKAASGIVAAAA